MKNKKIMIPVILTGNALAISALIFTLYIFISKPEFLKEFPDPDGAPLAFLLIGITLLICANRPWGKIIQLDTLPKEKRILRNDERNIQLELKSSNLSYEFLSISILFAVAILGLLGYLEGISYLVLYLLTVVSLLIKHLAKHYYANRM